MKCRPAWYVRPFCRISYEASARTSSSERSYGQKRLLSPRCQASVVQESSPLLAGELEVEVLESTEPADGQTESRWKPRGGPGIDRDFRAVRENGRHVVADFLTACSIKHTDIADLAAAATTMDVVSDDVWALRFVRVEPRGRRSIDFNHEVSRRTGLTLRLALPTPL